jgi:hypothetical protein
MKTLIKWLKIMTDPTCPNCQSAIIKLENMENETVDFRLRLVRKDGQRETHIGIINLE